MKERGKKIKQKKIIIKESKIEDEIIKLIYLVVIGRLKMNKRDVMNRSNKRKILFFYLEKSFIHKNNNKGQIRLILNIKLSRFV